MQKSVMSASFLFGDQFPLPLAHPSLQEKLLRQAQSHLCARERLTFLIHRSPPFPLNEDSCLEYSPSDAAGCHLPPRTLSTYVYQA